MCDNIVFIHDSIDDQPECYNCIFNAVCTIDLSSGFYPPGDTARIREQRDKSNQDYEF